MCIAIPGRGTHSSIDTARGKAAQVRPGSFFGFLDDGRQVTRFGEELRFGTDVIAKLGEDAWDVAVSSTGNHVAGRPELTEGVFRHLTLPERSGRIETKFWLERVFVGPKGTFVGLDAIGLLHVQRNQRWHVLGGHLGAAPVLSFSLDGRFIAATGTSGTVVRDRQGRGGGTFPRPVTAIPGGTAADFLLTDATGGPTGRVQWLDDDTILMLGDRRLHVFAAEALKEGGRIPIPYDGAPNDTPLQNDSSTPGFALSQDRSHVAIGQGARVHIFRLSR